MPALQFTRDLADLIRAGRKSQTLRATAPRGCVVGARLTLLNGYRAGATIGHAVVTSFDLVDVSALAEIDAHLDGFASLEELRARLRRLGAPSMLWRIRWREFTQVPAAARPRASRSQARHTRRQQPAGRRCRSRSHESARH